MTVFNGFALPRARGSARAIFVAALTLAVTAASFIPLAIYAHKGLAPVFALCALATVPYWISGRNRLSRTAAIVVCTAAGVLVLASAAWSITPMTSLKTGTSFVATLVGAYFLVRYAREVGGGGRRAAELAIVWGGLVGFGLLGVYIIPQEIEDHLFRDRSIYDAVVVNFWNSYKPALSAGALFVWPWSLLVLRHLPRYAASATIAIAVAMLALCEHDAPRLALLVGFLSACLAWLVPRGAARIYIAAVVIAIAAMPVIPRFMVSPLSLEARYDGFSESAIHRIMIWQTTASRIGERLVLGYGFDTSRALYPSDTRVRVQILPGTERSWSVFSEPIPLHPHNVILQVWLELGAAGAVVFAAFLISIIRSIPRSKASALATGTGYGMFGSALVLSSISFGAWQSWWLATVALTTAMTALAILGADNRHPPN